MMSATTFQSQNSILVDLEVCGAGASMKLSRAYIQKLMEIPENISLRVNRYRIFYFILFYITLNCCCFLF
jgi:hypothetical protein